MEREGRREVRGRRGGEMRKGRRGIVIGGMVIGLLMGCNNGIADELAAEKRLGEIGRSAENLFYSFMGLIADTLGFRVTSETKKSDVGSYFSGLGEKIGKASEELEEVSKKAAEDGDKDGPLNKAIKEAVDTAKATLKELKGYLDDLGTVGGDNLKIGEAASNAQGDTVDGGELKKTVEALKGIVKISKDSKAIIELKESNEAVSTVKGVATPQDGIKILATSEGAPSANDEGKATAILSKVSGEEILSAIIASTGSESALSSTAKVTTTASEFALGGSRTNTAQNAAKISAVAGGIALRSLVKNGKLASETNGKAVAEGVGKNAASKLILKVEDIIKKTVKNVLGTAKQKIDEARKSKAVGNE